MSLLNLKNFDNISISIENPFSLNNLRLNIEIYRKKR